MDVFLSTATANKRFDILKCTDFFFRLKDMSSYDLSNFKTNEIRIVIFDFLFTFS